MARISTEVNWNELDECQKRLVAAAYGQVMLGDLVYEANIADERFPGEDSLPWDATAELGIEDALIVSGYRNLNTSEGWSVRLPEDVHLTLSVWSD